MVDLLLEIKIDLILFSQKVLMIVLLLAKLKKHSSASLIPLLFKKPFQSDKP